MTNLNTLCEEWKIISSFPDYQISNFGRVETLQRKLRYTHSVTGNEHFRLSVSKLLKIQYNNVTGYKFCQLYKDKKMYNCTIHRLVALTFVSVQEGKDFVNHIDGNKHNNIFTNLEWCTNEYNHEHATKTGLIAFGSRVSTSVLNENSVLAIRKMINEGFSHTKIASLFGVSRSAISLIHEGVTWNRILTGTELTINSIAAQ